MTITEQLQPDASFSLRAAAAFAFGPNTGRHHSGQAGAGQAEAGADETRPAFVTDDMSHRASVLVAQRAEGSITAAFESAAVPGAVLGQVRRILALARPAAGWLAAGERDAVLGGLQREHDWLRPVLSH